MSLFRKLKLISEEELERLKQRQLEQYDPKLRVMARLQNQIENLLSSSDSSLTANERLRLLELFQHRFRDMKSSVVSQPKSKSGDDEEEEDTNVDQAAEVEPEVIPTSTASASVESTKASLTPSFSETILSSVATSKQQSARNIFDKIAKNPSILSYNDNLEAVVNGVAISGSNFVKLFHSIFSKKGKPSSLLGYSEFQNALGNLELSKTSSSSLATDPITSRLRSSSTSSSPPGQIPNVLHVYDDI